MKNRKNVLTKKGSSKSNKSVTAISTESVVGATHIKWVTVEPQTTLIGLDPLRR